MASKGRQADRFLHRCHRNQIRPPCEIRSHRSVEGYKSSLGCRTHSIRLRRCRHRDMPTSKRTNGPKTSSISSRDRSILWARSAGRCAFPNCGESCTRDATHADRASVVGEVAHIVSRSDTGPRADLEVPQEIRDSYENLILLCPSHHALVDKQPNTYTAKKLRQWKVDHEKRIQRLVATGMARVGFPELESIIKAISASPLSTDYSFDLTNLESKMQRNQLTPEGQYLVTTGIGQVSRVEQIVETLGRIRQNLSERLRAGFVTEYVRLRRDGHSGNELFLRMHSFASLRQHDIAYQAAGLAILVYFFDRCEVFER